MYAHMIPTDWSELMYLYSMWETNYHNSSLLSTVLKLARNKKSKK